MALQNLERYPIFDSHAHYDDERFAEIPDIFSKLPQEGVLGVVQCAVNLNSSKTAVNLAEQYPYFWAAVGIHPENLADGPFETELFAPLLTHPKTVAVGEIGLDYYWDSTHKAEQIALLEKQLQCAKSFGLPVILHDREAHADTLEVLQHYRPKGVLHCFSGSVEMARQVLDLGLYIGVGGVLTFKNARKTVEVVKMLPLERLLLETDAPYLAPEPMRGKLNRSDYIYYVGKKVAEIKNISPETVFQAALKNTQTLFSKIKL